MLQKYLTKIFHKNKYTYLQKFYFRMIVFEQFVPSLFTRHFYVCILTNFRENIGRLSSKVLRLLHRDTGPLIWLFSLYTLHICDFSPLLFQEMFSNILQSETLLFQLSFPSSAIARSSNKSNYFTDEVIFIRG